ncbi:MAG TPA: hypothetical protein VMW50_01300 [Dehalococcoidia bacterium]|nr:hypothetical protein [Dehalococcoidia bacterium]
MGIPNSELADLIATTLNDLPKQYFEVAWDNQDYEACRIYQNERMVVDGGEQIERQVMLDPLGNAKYRRCYDTDEPKVGQVMSKILVPWTQIGTDFSWDKFEILRNKNSAKGFINLMKVKRTEGYWSLANLIETRFWLAPISATDDLNPYGVPYYINCLNANVTTPGFSGQTIRYQNVSTGTICAGIDAANEAKWRNYAATYTQVDNALLTTFRLAFMNTRFKAPLIVNDPSQKRNAAKRVYADFNVCADLMALADAKDDKHTGKEVLGNLRVDEGGLVTLNRLPVVPIPQLVGVTDPVTSTLLAPIYCINFEKFIPYVHDGYWMEEGEPMYDRGQHTTFTVFVDGAHNNLCTNRREAGFVIHKPIVS